MNSQAMSIRALSIRTTSCRTTSPKPSTPRNGRAFVKLSKAEARLLEGLASGQARRHPCEEGRVIVSKATASRAGAVSLSGGSHPLEALDALVVRDLAAWAGSAASITEAGRACLRRMAAGADAPDDAFADQHREIAVASLTEDAPSGPVRRRVRVNNDESPLAWLASRKGADGRPLIDAACFEAGERFRRDLTLAGVMPGVTINWDRLGATGGSGGGHDRGNATDTCIAARQRIDKAAAHLGEDDADLLFDLCGFLKKIPLIEQERGWPARSAKIMIERALKRLAAHYGIVTEARGPSRSRGIGVWRADPAG
jgi:hypothetical protein